MKRLMKVQFLLFIMLAFLPTMISGADNPPKRQEIENYIEPLFKANKFNAVLAYLKGLDQEYPGNSDIQYFTGLAYAGLEDFDEAVNCLRNAISIQDTSTAYRLMLGNMYFAQAMRGSKLKMISRINQGKKEYEHVIGMDANNIPARYILMQFYSHAPGIMGGSKEKAAVLFDEMREIDGEHPQTRAAEIQMLMKAEKYMEAEQRLNQYASMASTGQDSSVFAQSYNMLGYFWLEKDECSHAIAALKSYTHLAPDNAHAHDRLGEAYYQCGYPDSAIVQYERALQIDPEFENSRKMLEKIATEGK